MEDQCFQDYDIALEIKNEDDIAISRQVVREFAQELNFSMGDIIKIATVVSELARNIYTYAKEGYIYIRKKEGLTENVVGIEILAYDNGPGIKNLDQVIGKHIYYERNLKLGLAGIRSLVDKFYVESQVGKGTVIKVEKRKVNLNEL